MWNGQRIVLPEVLKHQYIKELHRQHWDCKKIILTAEAVWWPTLDSDLKALVSNCEVCLAIRNKPPANFYQSWPRASYSLSVYIWILQSGKVNTY